MEIVVELFNARHEHQITVDDLKSVSARSLNNSGVYVKDDLFVHSSVEDLDLLLVKQGSTPFFIPEPYQEEPCPSFREEKEAYAALLEFLETVFTKDIAKRVCDDIFDVCQWQPTLTWLYAQLDVLDERFTEEKLDEFHELLANMVNNRRVWEYRGHSRKEMGQEVELEELLPSSNLIYLIRPITIILGIVAAVIWGVMRNNTMLIISLMSVLIYWDGLPRFMRIATEVNLEYQIEQIKETGFYKGSIRGLDVFGTILEILLIVWPLLHAFFKIC